MNSSTSYLMSIVGVKFASQRWAMVLVLSPTIIGSEDTGRGPPSPIMLARACLRGVRGGVPPRTHQTGVRFTPFTW